MRYAFAFLLLTACSSVLADGVVPLGDTYYFTFNTVQPSTGAPFTMGGTPAIDVYEEGTSTPITAGDTFTEDFNSVTGLHHVALVCTGANGYEAGKWYSAVVSGTTPTVDSVSVAGMTVARFRVVVGENVSGTPAVDVELIEGTAASSSLASAADIVNEWETQSQADPTGFHVNVMEVGGTAQTANDNGADINAILADTATLPTATPGSAGGLFIAGTNAPVTITGAGNALTLTSTGTNGNGLELNGNGTGSGFYINSGASSGDGITVSATGIGVSITATGDGIEVGSGVNALELGGTTSDLELTNDTAPSVLTLLGLASGNLDTQLSTIDTVVDAVKVKTDFLPSATAGASGGVFIAGTNAATTITSSSGSALTLSSTGANGHGLVATGNGSGEGITATGGATGHGLALSGGSSSGDGANITAQSGNAVTLGAGGNGHGAEIYGAGVGAGLDISGDTGINLVGSGADGMTIDGAAGGDDIGLGSNDIPDWITGLEWNDGGRLDLLLDTAAAGGGGGGGSTAIDMQSTTIATLASQTSFTLTAGSADDNAYPAGSLVFVTDQSTSTQKCVGLLRSYTGATKTVTLAADPGIFTMATGDTVDIVYLGPPRVRGN